MVSSKARRNKAWTVQSVERPNSGQSEAPNRPAPQAAKAARPQPTRAIAHRRRKAGKPAGEDPIAIQLTKTVRPVAAHATPQPRDGSRSGPPARTMPVSHANPMKDATCA